LSEDSSHIPTVGSSRSVAESNRSTSQSRSVAESERSTSQLPSDVPSDEIE